MVSGKHFGSAGKIKTALDERFGTLDRIELNTHGQILAIPVTPTPRLRRDDRQWCGARFESARKAQQRLVAGDQPGDLVKPRTFEKFLVFGVTAAGKIGGGKPPCVGVVDQANPLRKLRLRLLATEAEWYL